MTFGFRYLTVITLLLTFSVQLLASAVPPCPMLTAGPNVVLTGPNVVLNSVSLIALPDPSNVNHADMNHLTMNHAAMMHSEFSSSDNPPAFDRALPTSTGTVTMDCCDSDQSCTMDMCVMAPALPSLVYVSYDFAVAGKPAIAAELVFALLVEPVFHPPRFA